MSEYTKRKRGISIKDLETAMGRKADKVSDYIFDPETGSWSRNITFKLQPCRKRRASLSRKAPDDAPKGQST